MKKFLINTAKVAVVGAVTNKAVRMVLPRFVPGGVVGLIALNVASKILKKKK